MHVPVHNYMNLLHTHTRDSEALVQQVFDELGLQYTEEV